MEHNCEEFKKLKEDNKDDRNAGGYCSYYDWNVWEDGRISVNCEYGIDIKFCPFCGKKLTK